MISIEEIESLNFTHLGSRWFKKNDEDIRLRQWKDSGIDIWYWPDIPEERKLVFCGVLYNTEEVKWILERCFKNY